MPAQWEHFKLPGKRLSTFDFVFEEKRVAIAAGQLSIMTDTDNTKSVARAWYGLITLVPGQR